MRIVRIVPSRHKKDRVLVFLEDGALLKVTGQELLDFGLRRGDDLDGETLAKLKRAGNLSHVKETAAAMIGRRAMSRQELAKKLREKGAGEEEAETAVQWLASIGALDDAAYAGALVRRCAALGYGPAKTREKLREKGIPRELWEESLQELPPSEAGIDAFLAGKLRGRRPEEGEKRRLTNALLRRGYGWEDIKDAWSRLGAEIGEE